MLEESKPSQVSPTGVAQKNHGLFCVWHGLNRRRWSELKKKAGPFPPKNRGRRLSINVASLSNSWHEQCEKLLYGRAVARVNIEHPPLFVLGHWRSGTTLLHNLLTYDRQLTYPNLYQVMFPGHFLLTEKLLGPLSEWALPKTRPMDNVPTSWAMSQEDEVALQLRTLLSPYLMLAFQGHRPAYERFFELSQLTPDELELWKREFLLFLKKLTYRANRPIVLKSPTHTYRIPLLLDMFPNAKFIYIHRDPYTVINSSLHLRRTLFEQNALGEVSFENLEEDTLLTYEHCIRRYESTKHLIPPGQLHELRFTDLEANPVAEMQRIYESLSLPGWNQMEPALRQQMPEHQRYRKNQFQMDRTTRQRLYDRLKFAFDQYGYESGL